MILATIAALVTLPAPGFARESPPAPGPPRPLRLARPAERVLPNGLRVLVVPRPTVPLVVARMMVKNGADADPPGKAGVARLTADLINQHTETHSASRAVRAAESLGATLAGSMSWDATSVWAVAMTPRFRPAFALFGDMIEQAVFTPGEVAGMKEQIATSMLSTFSDPASLADMTASRLLFGPADYGIPMGGTPETLRRIGRVDLMDFHLVSFRPENAVLFFGGDITPEDAFALAERTFKDWNPPPASVHTSRDGPDGPRRPSPRVALIDHPHAGQAAIALAWKTVERGHPDLYAGMVADSLLSGETGRLMRELRVKRGLTYGADSAFAPHRRAGEFTVTTEVDAARAVEAAGLLLDTVRGLGKENVPEDVLKTRKMAVIGQYARATESIEGLIAQAALFAAYDLPLSEMETFIPKIEAVTAGDVRRFAEATFSPDPVVVIVGDAKAIRDDLRKRYPDLRVLPLAKLDLEQPDLLKVEEEE